MTKKNPPNEPPEENILFSRVDDLQLLLNLFPNPIQDELMNYPDIASINEIIFDLGHIPEIRVHKNVIKLEHLKEITQQDIDSVTKKVGKFDSDNRAGIERTLHRISALRNRSGTIIGLTCRVGRAIFGAIEVIRDITESGKNILFLGPPASGKTTFLRETARVLSTDLNKRVMVVDTSNEIAGDGDLPHPGIGSARRLQVPSPEHQHATMIEAVQNHNPEVIIIDEIGTEEETKAARTIAERGVQLVATAHGFTLPNLIKNPTLSDLIGSIQSVILGDEEAKFRGTQKTVLERKSPPTFDTLIEIRDRDVLAVYEDVAQAVDTFLRDEELDPEIRTQTEAKRITLETEEVLQKKTKPAPKLTGPLTVIFPFGIKNDRLYEAIHMLQVPVTLAQTIGDADLILTIKSQLKSKSKLTQITKGRNIPLHVLKANTAKNIQKFLKETFRITETEEELEKEALLEIKKLCTKVKQEVKVLDATPHPDYIRRLQHQKVEKLGLNSLSIGEEPNRRVRIYPT